jgi:hypothetical protein
MDYMQIQSELRYGIQERIFGAGIGETHLITGRGRFFKG